MWIRLIILFSLPAIFTGCSSTLPTKGQMPVADSFRVGSKSWVAGKYTLAGTPVVPMWKGKMPVPDSSHIPLLPAEHRLVWQPATKEEGGYNHYACLIKYRSTFFAMWANHSLGEDAPGQRILFARSGNWQSWSMVKELFPAPGPVKARHEKGIHYKPDRWAIVNDTLYAIVFVHAAGRYPIAMPVNEDGTTGAPFLLDNLAAGAALPKGMEAMVVGPAAAAIKEWYRNNDQISWWANEAEGVSRKAVDGAALIESFMYRAKDNTLVLMLRNWGTPSNPVHNNRVYASFSKDRTHWSKAYPTDIPDAPTRGQALRLEDGTILLIGTQYVREFDKPYYIDRDPLTVSVSNDGFYFDREYAIRTGAPKTWHIPGVGGRNPGFAYTSSIVDEGYLYTLYSIGKEDMAISRVLLANILKKLTHDN